MKYRAISLTENFKLKLEKQTNDEPIIWFITPKLFNEKPFCGEISHSTFQLSLNSFLPENKVVSIKGNFKKQNENEFLVEFNIGISRFAKIWNIAVIIFVFVFFNFIIYKNEGHIEWIPNIAILSIVIFGFLMLQLLINRVKSRFIKKLNLKNVEKLD